LLLDPVDVWAPTCWIFEPIYGGKGTPNICEKPGKLKQIQNKQKLTGHCKENILLIF
jgi:hypothetical protein